MFGTIKKIGAIGTLAFVALGISSAAAQPYVYNQTGAVITSPDVARVALNNIAGKISSRLASFNKKFGTGHAADQGAASLNWSSDDPTGLAGGTGRNPNGFWANGSYTDLSDKNRPTAYEGNLFNVTAGYDYNLDRFNTVLGAAMTVEIFDANTSFNDGELAHYGIGITPYFAWRFMEYFSVSALAGYQRTIGKAKRNSHGGIANAMASGIAGREIVENYDSDRYFAAANLNANYIWRYLSLDARIGAQWMQEWLSVDNLDRAYYEPGSNSSISGGNNNRIGQAIFEIKPGMFFKIDRGSYIKPYLMTQYQWDFENLEKKFASPFEGLANHYTAGLLVGAGMDLFSARGFHFNLEFSSELLRKRLNENTLSAYFRVDF